MTEKAGGKTFRADKRMPRRGGKKEALKAVRNKVKDRQGQKTTGRRRG